MSDPQKNRVSDNPNCWLCVNGKIDGGAKDFSEFLDVVSVHCKLELRPGSFHCMKQYQQKNIKK